MKGFYLLAILTLNCFLMHSQKQNPAPTPVKNTVPKKKTPTPELNDFVCTLHEESINKVLVAIGDIKGSSDYEVMFITGKYHWTIKDAKINIRPDSSSFTCDALVNVGPFDYKTQVLGDVKITYNNDSNIISIRISRAIFELYTMVLGKKIHIKDIHLEDHFKDPFQFEGPKTIATEMEFTMPDSTKKKIYLVPTDCKMQLKFKEICTSCEIAAAEVRGPVPVKTMPPIEGTKASTLHPAQTGKK